MKKAKPTLKFLVPYKPLNNIELVPIVLTYFASNLILSKQENSSLMKWLSIFKKKWHGKRLGNFRRRKFFSESKPFIDLVKNRLTQTSHLSNKDRTYGENIY